MVKFRVKLVKTYICSFFSSNKDTFGYKSRFLNGKYSNCASDVRFGEIKYSSSLVESALLDVISELS